MKSKVFLIQSEGLGRGDERLGLTLMANLMQVLWQSKDKPSSLVFWNTGVRLVCEDSEVLDYVKEIEKQGVEILTCKTCLEYFNLMDKLVVGKPTTMPNSVQSMLSCDVVTL